MANWANSPERLLRLWVKKTDTCWLWIGSLSKTGYGKVQMKGKDALPHRVLFEHLRGPVQPGLEIDHLCRNRSCVNPDHLEPVTPKENQHRGNGVSGINWRKTHCDHGHVLEGENLYNTRDGRRQCRACRAAATRRYQGRLACR